MKLRTLLATTAVVSALVAAADGQAQSANLATTQSSLSGLNLNTGMSNAVSQTAFSNDGSTLIVIKNGSGGAITATIVTQATQMSQAGYGTVTLSDQTISIPSASTVIAGPFPTGRWGSPVYGTTLVSVSTVTGVSVTALKTAQ